MSRRKLFMWLAFIQAAIVFLTDLEGLLILRAANIMKQEDPVGYVMNFPRFQQTLAGLHKLGLTALVGFFAFYLLAHYDEIVRWVKNGMERQAEEPQTASS